MITRLIKFFNPLYGETSETVERYKAYVAKDLIMDNDESGKPYVRYCDLNVSKLGLIEALFAFKYLSNLKEDYWKVLLEFVIEGGQLLLFTILLPFLPIIIPIERKCRARQMIVAQVKFRSR